MVKVLKDANPRKTMDNVTAVIAIFAERATDRKRRAKVAEALMQLISAELKYEFVVRVLSCDLLGRGRIQAIATLNYKLISPFVLCDFLFSKTDGDLIAKAAKMFDKDDVVKVVKFVAENFEKEDVVLAKLRSLDCLRPYYIIGEGTWSAYKCRALIIACCAAWEFEPPPETNPVYMAVGIGPSLDAFLRHEMEPEDFFFVCKDLAGKRDEDWRRCIDYIAEKCPSLASFVSARAGFGSREYDAEFVPSCTAPFSEKLHQLPHHAGYVLEDDDIVDSFERRIKDSSVYLMDFHGTVSVDDTRGRVGLVTFVFPAKIYYFIPRFSSSVAKRVRQIVKDNPRPVIVFKWETEKKDCKKTFGWTPEKLFNAAAIAKERDLPRSLDSLAERLVEGCYCRRASNFTDTVVPSSEALRHRAIKGCLVYDFVAGILGLEPRAAVAPRSSKRSHRDDDADNDSGRVKEKRRSR